MSSAVYRRVAGVWKKVGASGNVTPPPPTNHAPGPVSNLTSTATDTTVTLTWTGSVDQDGDLAGYTIFRDGVSQGDLSSITTSTTITGLSASTTYTFGVQAFDSTGLKSTTVTTTITTAAAPNNSPLTSGLDVNASTVGPRIALTAYNGDWSVASQGSPSGKDISGRLLLDKVGTYRDFRARNGVNVSVTGGVMEYFELGPDSGNATNNSSGAGIVYGGYTARYGKIHNFSDGLKIEGGLLEYCWIYNLTQESTADHNDGMQASAGSNITIRGCRISRTEGYIQTSCILIGADLGNISNVLIEKNLFESSPGFQVCMYWGHSGSYTATGCTIQNNYITNTFTTLLSANDPYTASGNVWVTQASDGTWVPGALITSLNNA